MPVFPLPFRPRESYRVSPRSFGSSRAGGARKHAGVDLYAPVGTHILAIDDGVIISYFRLRRSGEEANPRHAAEPWRGCCSSTGRPNAPAFLLHCLGEARCRLRPNAPTSLSNIWLLAPEISCVCKMTWLPAWLTFT